MDAWDKLLEKSTIVAGDAWEHLVSAFTQQAPVGERFTLTLVRPEFQMGLNQGFSMTMRSDVLPMAIRDPFTMTLQPRQFSMELCPCLPN